MLLFSHLNSCLVYLLVVKCADRKNVLANSFWCFRNFNWKGQHLHHVGTIFFFTCELCVLQVRMFWKQWVTVFSSKCSMSFIQQRIWFLVFSLSICVFPPLKSEQAGRQEGMRDMCLDFNGYHKCFSYSTPSETSLPLSTLPNYSYGMKLGLFALQSVSVFPS